MHSTLKGLVTILLLAAFVKPSRGQEVTADMAWTKSTYNYLLMVEADSGNIHKVRDLLALGADPNTSDERGATPLMFAVQSGNIDLVELLIESGANVNAYPQNGNTALHAAVIAANDSIAELLIRNGAEINAKNVKGLTPLHFAVWYGLPYLTDILIYYGADVNAKDYRGNTPLMLAAYAGAKLSARLLLENGANPDLTDVNKVSPLMVAAQFNDTIICNYLISYGADISLTDTRGANALCYAIANNSYDVVRCLSENEALQYTLNKSYYQIAKEHYNREAMQFFANQGLKTRIKPTVSSVYVGMGTQFARHEFLLGYFIGFAEQISRAEFALSYWYRPSPMATLTDQNGQLIQYWEKRRIIQANLSRSQLLYQYKKWKVSASGQISLGVAFRNYKATPLDPKATLNPTITGGISVKGNTMEYTMGNSYSFYKQLDVLPYMVTISAKIHFNTLRPRVINKSIKHVQ